MSRIGHFQRYQSQCNLNFLLDRRLIQREYLNHAALSGSGRFEI